MKSFKINFTLVLSVLFNCLIVTSCTDKWVEHNGADNPLLGETLFQQISKNPELSKFSEYLVKTEYDKVLSSSKLFTVWAPTNDALAGLSLDIINDNEKLEQFVANHISNQSYQTTGLNEPRRIKVLSGKYLTFSQSSIDDVSLAKSNQVVGNGVFHIINGVLEPKQNAWEALNDLTSIGLAQKAYLQSVNYEQFDPTISTQTGINANGQPVYDSVFVVKNAFLQNVADLTDESKQYTFIVLTDQAFEDQQNKLSKFYKLTSTTTGLDSTARYARANLVKDLVFSGYYKADEFPGVVYSRDSVKVNLSAANIVETHKVSNGVVYVMNNISYDLADKFRPIMVQGERPIAALNNRGYTVRTRKDPFGVIFNDILVENHGVNTLWYKYSPVLNSVTYDVYWRVVRDFTLVPAAGQTSLVNFPQKIVFGTLPTAAGFGYKPAPVINEGNNKFSPDYEEKLLGQLVVDKYGSMSMYLVGNTVTTNAQNTILLDYVKLVPVLN